jgi:hypothetical protein
MCRKPYYRGITRRDSPHISALAPLAAQTGWTQGAAGVGAFFVHLDGKRRGRPDRILPPESPWRCVTPVAGGGGGAHVA